MFSSAASGRTVGNDSDFINESRELDFINVGVSIMTTNVGIRMMTNVGIDVTRNVSLQVSRKDPGQSQNNNRDPKVTPR